MECGQTSGGQINLMTSKSEDREVEWGILKSNDAQRGKRGLTNLANNCVQIQPLVRSAFNLRILLPHSLLVTLVRLLVCQSVGYDNLQQAWKQNFIQHITQINAVQFLEVKTSAKNYCRPHRNINPNHAAWKRTGTEGTIHFTARVAQQAGCYVTTAATCGPHLCLILAEVRRQQIYVDYFNKAPVILHDDLQCQSHQLPR